MSDSNVFAADLNSLQGRHSSKWRRFPKDVLPLHVAEMDFQIADSIRDRIIKMATESDLGYLGPVPEVAESFGTFALARWGWRIDKSKLKMATDVGVGVVEFLRANGASGSKVIVTSPVYHGFWDWLAELNITPIDVPLNEDYSLDLDGIERAFAGGVKFLLLCNPQNPVGVAFSREELTSLAAIARENEAVVISDEIHAPLTSANKTFTPYLSCGIDAELTGVCITSASKSWNLAGLKAAFLLTQSDVMAARVEHLPQASHWRSSILGAFALAEAYSNGVTWLDSTLHTLDANSHHLASELKSLFPDVVYNKPDAGYLGWLDVSSWGYGESTVEHLLNHAKVALVPGNDHGPQYTNFVRLNFASSPEIISDALHRIKATLA